MTVTPIGLIHALAGRIRGIVSEIRMEESDGDHILRAPNVWEQTLPEKLYDEVPDPADYPFVRVVLGGGVGITGGHMPCVVAIQVCGYDDGQPLPEDPSTMDHQGWLQPAALAWRIITSLAVNPTIGPFALDTENLSWDLPDFQDQPAPLWNGIITSTWSVPIPERDFNLGNIPTYFPPPCEAALKEDIRTFIEGDE